MSQVAAGYLCVRPDLSLTLTKCCRYLNNSIKKLNNATVTASAECIARLPILEGNKWHMCERLIVLSLSTFLWVCRYINEPHSLIMLIENVTQSASRFPQSVVAVANLRPGCFWDSQMLSDTATAPRCSACPKQSVCDKVTFLIVGKHRKANVNFNWNCFHFNQEWRWFFFFYWGCFFRYEKEGQPYSKLTNKHKGWRSQ